MPGVLPAALFRSKENGPGSSERPADRALGIETANPRPSPKYQQKVSGENGELDMGRESLRYWSGNRTVGTTYHKFSDMNIGRNLYVQI